MRLNMYAATDYATPSYGHIRQYRITFVIYVTLQKPLPR